LDLISGILRYLSGMKEGITRRERERKGQQAEWGGKGKKGLKLEAKPEVGERSTNPPRTGSKELRVFFSTIRKSNRVNRIEIWGYSDFYST
jgi:hypothetical protein